MNRLSRKYYAAAGVLVLLMAGLVYAWSVLSSPIAAEFPLWTKAQLSLTFTIVMGMFCLGSLIGGFLVVKLDPRILSLAAALLMLAGFALSSRLDSLGTLYLGFGVMCGLGSGLAYIVVMSTVSKRFADCQGLISGVLLMGFGISSFLIGKLYQVFTPETVGAWRGSFRWIGWIVFLVLVLCTPFLSRPREAAAGGKPGAGGNPDVPTARMLRTPSFWLYYLWSIALSAAGLILVSQSTGIAMEVGTSASMDTIATVVGLISICNGVGRVLFGGLFDRKGRQATMMLANVLFVAAGLLLTAALLSRSFALLIAGFVVGGLAYGSVTPTNSAFVNAYFGEKYYRVNFPIVNTNLLVASFGSTVAGALFDRSGSYLSTYALILALAGAGIAITCVLRVTDQRLQKRRHPSGGEGHTASQS